MSVRVTVTGVDTDWVPKVAVTLATPPIFPDGVITPVDGLMVATWPRSMENDAATAVPPSVTL